MTEQTFIQLKIELQQMVKQHTFSWGKVQNNSTDALLDIFKIPSYALLEQAISNFNDAEKSYFKKRWFVLQCSKCDEYLFCLNKNVKANTQKKDKAYDIEFYNNINLQFDIKGTVIPKQFIANAQQLIHNPQPLIHFFYEQQSKGVRLGFQNRLFIVHHSFKKQEREIILRCHFDFKEKAFADYATAIASRVSFFKYQQAIADVIFIIENEDGSFERKFG